MKCEACGEEASEFVHLGLTEVVGIGRHLLCTVCLTELNQAESLVGVRAAEAAATLRCQVLVRYFGTFNASQDTVLTDLTKASEAQIRAVYATYRASVEWIDARRAEKERNDDQG